MDNKYIKQKFKPKNIYMFLRNVGFRLEGNTLS
jgi:hypothetical protein